MSYETTSVTGFIFSYSFFIENLATELKKDHFNDPCFP